MLSLLRADMLMLQRVMMMHVVVERIAFGIDLIELSYELFWVKIHFQ